MSIRMLSNLKFYMEFFNVPYTFSVEITAKLLKLNNFLKHKIGGKASEHMFF